VQPVFRIDRPEDWFNALCPYLGMPGYQEFYLAGNAPKPGERTVFVCPEARVTGSYLGCGTGEKSQPDVRWNPGFPGDPWAPNL
jgi:hypothetical protein